MTTTTTGRAAQVVTEIYKHGGVPYAWADERRSVIVLRIFGRERLPMQLLLEASLHEQEIIAGLLDFAARGYEP